ncbi:MAG: carboxypeptidase-like regulatory domain-containing protein [Acidobacteriia bacterium]|nr:carboxypeptidase-like regulatory domain-containing protein [Terriglobia bacterium]
MKSRILPAIAFVAFFMGQSAYGQFQAYLAQVVNGNFGNVSFATTFICFNDTNATVTAILTLTDNNGNPLSVTMTGLGTGSQFSITLGPGATDFLQTDGRGSGAVGAATVTATTPIGVSAVFTVNDANGNFMTEAGVGSSALLTDFVLPVDSTGSFLTGFALYSPAGNASITLTLINPDGSQAGTAPLSLGNGAHTAGFVAAAGQFFPTMTNFRGTLRVQSSSPIAALVLRQYQTSSKLTYTSLPVVTHSSGKLALDLAQVANGSFGSISFKTSFLIFSISSAPAHVSLALTQDNGSPFTVNIPGSGPGTGTGSNFSFTLAPGASVFLQTDGLGAGTAGAATITSDVPLGASAIFTVFDSQGQFETEAGVGDSPSLTSMTLPVDITGTSDTGVAFFNPGSASATLTLKLLDANGTIRGTKTEPPLGSNNHLSLFVDQLFPGTANFRGSLAITASSAVAAMTLRQDSPSASLLTYTTLPTAAGAATGQAATPVLLSKTETAISATANLIMNETLPAGFKLSGTISGTGTAVFVVASAGGNTFFSSSLVQQNTQYLIVVPSGLYNLTVSFQPAGLPPGVFVQMTYADPNPVQVSGDTVRNITLPAVTLFNVSGSLLGLSTLPPSISTVVVFTSSDDTVQGLFAPDANGNFQGMLPTGNYVASLSRSGLQFSALQTEQMAIYNLGSLVMGNGPASGTFMIPNMATLSGTINTGGLPSVLFTSLSAMDTSAPLPTQAGLLGFPATSSMGVDTSGQYQAVLAQNRSYSINAAIGFTLGSSNGGSSISFPVPPNSTNLSGNATLNLSVPALPATVTISGQVTDASGNGVANTAVFAISQSIAGAPNLSFTASTRTDTNGHYSMVVYSGTNYQITYTPPRPTS